MLAATGDLSRSQGRADGQGGVVEGRKADPRHTTEQRTRTRGSHHTLRRRLIARHDRGAGEPAECAALDAPRLPLLTGARGDERVVGRPVAVLAPLAVSRDGAVDEPRVPRREGLVVETKLRRGAGRPAVDEHVRRLRKSEDRAPPFIGGEVDCRPSLTPEPHPTAGQLAKWVATGRVDLRDSGAEVRQQHPRHRSGDTAAQIQYVDVVQNARHDS